jgi:hypothetical protein
MPRWAAAPPVLTSVRVPVLRKKAGTNRPRLIVESCCGLVPDQLPRVPEECVAGSPAEDQELAAGHVVGHAH